MTNWERLLDLPLREIIKEFDRQEAAKYVLACSFVDFMICDGTALPCKICDDISGSCATVCECWFDLEADPDANYNLDVWHDALIEDPPTSDLTLEYQVFIHGAELPTQLIFDGDHWLDNDGNHYKVDYWRPLPSLSSLLK